MRECQVLHDQLLMLLQRHSWLKAEDIVVMVPEISRYAPYIEAVFQPDDSGKRLGLPWNISDISIADGHPLVKNLLQLLNWLARQHCCGSAIFTIAVIWQPLASCTTMLYAPPERPLKFPIG